MGKRKLLAIVFALVLGMSLSAESLDTIIQSAKENSPSYKNTQITYQNNLINLQQMDKEDEAIITIGGSVTPITETKIDENTIRVMSISPTFSVKSPDKNTTVSGNVGYTMDYDNTFRTVSPELELSHTFDFSGFDSDSLEDLNYSISKITTEKTYMEGEYEFEKTVINTIESLLSALKQLDNTNKQIQDTRTQIENIDKLGTVSKDSVVYKNLMNSLTVLENTKDSLDAQYENAKANYKIFTGLEWDGVENISEPKLDLNVLEGGNSSVLLASLAIQKAQDEYNQLKAQQNPIGLKVNGKTSGSYTNSDFRDSGSYSIGGGMTYSANNWTIGANHTSTWKFDSGKDPVYSPSLTISGTWTNGSLGATGVIDSTRDDLALQAKQNEIMKANNDYVSAMTSYTQQAQALSVQVMQWNFEKSQADSNMSYLEAVLADKEALFDQGLATQKDVDDAAFDVAQAEYDYQVMLLKGLSLERDLKIFAL